MHPIKRQKKICSVKKQLRETRFRGKNCEDVGHLIYIKHIRHTQLEIVPSYRDNAFVASPFPLILSIEDHCSLAQQSTIAQIFR